METKTEVKTEVGEVATKSAPVVPTGDASPSPDLVGSVVADKLKDVVTDPPYTPRPNPAEVLFSMIETHFAEEEASEDPKAISELADFCLGTLSEDFDGRLKEISELADPKEKAEWTRRLKMLRSMRFEKFASALIRKIFVQMLARAPEKF